MAREDSDSGSPGAEAHVEYVPLLEEDIPKVGDLDGKAISNLMSIRDILASSVDASRNSTGVAASITEPPRMEKNSETVDQVACEGKRVVHFVRRTDRIDTLLSLWEKYEIPEQRDLLQGMTIDTPYGDLKPTGFWEDQPVVALDYLTGVVKRWITHTSKEVSGEDLDSLLALPNGDGEECLDDQGASQDSPPVIEMNWLLKGSNIVARIEKRPKEGYVLSDVEKQKRKVQEGRYQRLLGKTLNTKMRGESVKDRYVNAEIKASLAVGTGHMTGLITAGLLGYYLATYVFDEDHVGRYLGGLIAVVIFLFMEALLFMFRETRIQRTIRQADRDEVKRHKKAFEPTRDLSGSTLIHNAVEEKKAIQQGTKGRAARKQADKDNKAKLD